MTAEKRLGQANAARRAVEGAAAAGVRVRIDHDSAGQRIGIVGDDDMADALLAAHVVEALDAETRDELARLGMRRGRERLVRRHEMVERHDDALSLAHHLQFVELVIVPTHDGNP